MGPDALGFLLYTADNRFSVMISRQAALGSPLATSSAGPPRNRAAVGSFVAYAGHYSFHGDRVVCHVELSLSPTGSGPTSSGRSNAPGIG